MFLQHDRAFGDAGPVLRKVSYERECIGKWIVGNSSAVDAEFEE